MEELHKVTEETISLYIPDGDARVCIERLESPQMVRMVARVGERMPFYAGASGKALLAFLPPEQQKTILKNVPLERLTTSTIQDPKVLLHELALIQERGYAFSQGERVEGASSVAAPIFNATGKVIGAINISGPSTRFSKQKIQEYAALLVQATGHISKAMGYLSKEPE
jgi:DNA-binding IclR family transcriptional regulator